MTTDADQPVRQTVLKVLQAECRHTSERHPPRGNDLCGECGDLADLICGGLGDFIYGQQKRMEASEAYKEGRTDGYRAAFDLFGPELDSGREARSILREARNLLTPRH